MAESFSDLPFQIVQEDWTFALDWPAITETEPFDVVWGTAANISDATNASPIVVTTSAAHGLTSGNLVYITGVLGNLAANGYHAVTVINSTQFSLRDTTGTGAYAGGGTVQPGFSAEPHTSINGMVRIRMFAMPWNPCSGTGADPRAPRPRRFII